MNIPVDAAPVSFGDVRYPLAERKSRPGGADVVLVEGGPPGGRPLVLVPPIGRGLMHFRSNLEALAARRRVVAYDPPGTGKSAKGDPAWDTVAAQLSVLAALVEEVAGGGPADLAGASFGGALALRLAAERPDLVRSVVAADVPGGTGRFAQRVLSTALFRPRLMAALPAAAWRSMIARFFPGPHPHVEESAAFIARLRGTPDWRRYTASLARLARSATADLALEAAFPRVRAPVLLVWGEADAVTPLAFGRAAAAAIPGARLAILAGCGHFPNIQVPEEFNGLVEGFLNEP